MLSLTQLAVKIQDVVILVQVGPFDFVIVQVGFLDMYRGLSEGIMMMGTLALSPRVSQGVDRDHAFNTRHYRIRREVHRLSH